MSNIEQLREKAKALGIDVDGRWSEARIQAEIETVEAGGKDDSKDESVKNKHQIDNSDLELKILEHEETIESLNKTIADLRELVKGQDEIIAGLEKNVQETKTLVSRATNTEPGDYTKPFVIKNLTQNSVKSLGLAGGGSVVIGEDKIGDEKLIKRIKHGIAIGNLARG